jgi:hypothetical protein
VRPNLPIENYRISLKNIELAVADIVDAPLHLHKAINEVQPGKPYYKFICFFPQISSLVYNMVDAEIIQGWFRKAFPDYNVRTLICASRKEYINNIHRLDEFRETPNTIDLIGGVNMLTMGYHVPDLTGILVYRNSSSYGVNQQMFGRVMKLWATEPAIIIDCVGSIFTPYLFGTKKEIDTAEAERAYVRAITGSENQDAADVNKIRKTSKHKLLTSFVPASVAEIMYKFERSMSEEEKQVIIYTYEDTKGNIPTSKLATRFGYRDEEVIRILKSAGVMRENGTYNKTDVGV